MAAVTIELAQIFLGRWCINITKHCLCAYNSWMWMACGGINYRRSKMTKARQVPFDLVWVAIFVVRIKWAEIRLVHRRFTHIDQIAIESARVLVCVCVIDKAWSSVGYLCNRLEYPASAADQRQKKAVGHFGRPFCGQRTHDAAHFATNWHRCFSQYAKIQFTSEPPELANVL